jgi:hypothetical protein
MFFLAGYLNLWTREVLVDKLPYEGPVRSDSPANRHTVPVRFRTTKGTDFCVKLHYEAAEQKVGY